MSGALLAAVNLLQQETLEVNSPALIEPEMSPIGTRCKVTRPRVAELVQQDIGQAAVAADERGRQSGQVGVLHTTVWERRWKHDGIVASP